MYDFIINIYIGEGKAETPRKIQGYSLLVMLPVRKIFK